MEKDFKSWFHDQRTDWQSSVSNPLSAPFQLGQQYTVPSHGNTCSNMPLPNESPPVIPFSAGQLHGKTGQPNEPRGWFYCLPRFRQAFAPGQNSVPKVNLPASLNENSKGAEAASHGVRKRFVVFDQSGDQTTVMFSPSIGAPVQYLPSWSSKPHCAFELKGEDPGIKRCTIHWPFSFDECNEQNEKDDVRSEMHEDTEELNALLYSDDEIDYSEDEEETSTGHYPSTMTCYDRQEWLDENVEEEVASSAGPAKRQKLANGGGYDVPSSLMDTATSLKTDKKSSVYEFNDAELSSCGDGKNVVVFGESGSLSGNKRSFRNERVRETISILQNLIPGGKNSKDAIVVIDEAIHYLKSLKAKAQALGHDSL